MATYTNNFSGVTGQPLLQPLQLLQQSAQLNAASKDLVEAVAERALTAEEAKRACIGNDLIECVQAFLAPEHNGAFNVGYLAKLHAEYNAKFAAYIEKKDAYEMLEERRFMIAGEANQKGRLGEIRKALTPAELDRVANKQMDKMHKYYHELSRTVGDVNEYARARELHKIID